LTPFIYPWYAGDNFPCQPAEVSGESMRPLIHSISMLFLFHSVPTTRAEMSLHKHILRIMS
jgi:signal peptidase I